MINNDNHIPLSVQAAIAMKEKAAEIVLALDANGILEVVEPEPVIPVDPGRGVVPIGPGGGLDPPAAAVQLISCSPSCRMAPTELPLGFDNPPLAR